MGPQPQLLRLADLDAGLIAFLRVGLRAEVLEELPLKDIPVSLQPGLPQLLRQGLQLVDVVRLRLHQRQVVCDQALYERVILGTFSCLVPLVNKDPLDVAVALASGVAGVIDPLWQVVGAAQAGRDGFHLVFAELRRLVQENDIELRALVLVQVRIVSAVAEFDGAAVPKGQDLVPVVVLGVSHQLGPEDLDVVVHQLRVGPPDNQHLDALVLACQQLGLCPHRPALAAASGTSEADVLGPGFDHHSLLPVRPAVQRDRIAHSISSSTSPYS